MLAVENSMQSLGLCSALAEETESLKSLAFGRARFSIENLALKSYQLGTGAFAVVIRWPQVRPSAARPTE